MVEGTMQTLMEAIGDGGDAGTIRVHGSKNILWKMHK